MLDPVDIAIEAAMRELAGVQQGGSDMERDMELVRVIFRAIKAKADLTPRAMTIDGYDDAVVTRHIAMLYNAGYIDGTPWDGGDVPGGREILVVDLSWQGHEFAGALLTDEGVWQKVKAALGPERLANIPLKMIENVAMSALTAWGLKQMGLG